MKKITILIIALFIGTLALTQSPIGKWKTMDDETGKKKSIVEIYEVDGKLYGKIIQLFRGPDEEQDPICDECKGDKKNKKIIGMEILTDLEKDGDEWEDGDILDPNNGKTYSCNVEMVNDDKLKLRGYIGFSLIGRTQYWYRDK